MVVGPQFDMRLLVFDHNVVAREDLEKDLGRWYEPYSKFYGILWCVGQCIGWFSFLSNITTFLLQDQSDRVGCRTTILYDG